MKVLIRQQSGLGDIIYLQKVIYKLNEKYHPEQIIWPLDELYMYAKTYLDTPSNVLFVCDKDEFEHKDIYLSDAKEVTTTDNLIYIPFQFSHEIKYNNNFKYIMRSKYEFVNLDGADWYDFVKIKRNQNKERELFDLIIKDKSKPYIIVNKSFGPITNAKKRSDIDPKTNLNVIEMSNVDGFSPFDWSFILENAQEVHTVETSIAYILKILNIKNVQLYYRAFNSNEIKRNPYHPWRNFEYCKFIHSDPSWHFESI